MVQPILFSSANTIPDSHVRLWWFGTRYITFDMTIDSELVYTRFWTSNDVYIGTGLLLGVIPSQQPLTFYTKLAICRVFPVPVRYKQTFSLCYLLKF